MPSFLRPGSCRDRFFQKAVVISACLVLGPSSASFAFDIPDLEFGPRQYVCLRALEPIAVDGLLTESAWRTANPTQAFVDIEGPVRPDPEFKTTVRMLYDDNYLYFAAELEEPHVWATLTDRDAVIYHDNDFEIFIDPDGDNHLYYELEINALGTEWDLMLVRPYRDGGPAINAWDIQGLRTAVQVNGTLNDPDDIDQGWSVEIAIPWKVMAQAAGRPAPPRPGDIWRVNFSRVQWDTRVQDGRYVKLTDPTTGDPLPEHNWVWSPQGLIAMHYPEMWGEVLFAEDDSQDFSASLEHRAIGIAATLMPVYYRQKQYREDHGRFADSLKELGLYPPPFSDIRSFSLKTCGDTFTATISTQYVTATVDQDGRLERKHDLQQVR